MYTSWWKPALREKVKQIAYAYDKSYKDFLILTFDFVRNDFFWEDV